MAEYLIQDTTLTAIGDAIRAKTETTDLISVSDIPGKIAAIETGVTVQEATGTFQTSNGSATANCGFQPDVVNIFASEAEEVEASVLFSGSSNSKPVSIYYAESIGYCVIKRTTTGFSISDFVWYGLSGGSSTDTGNTYTYNAIKYTE